MNIDPDKVDGAVLALLQLGLHENNRVWKGFDWEAMQRLHAKGYISDPVGKAKSVGFTEAGPRESTRLLQFGRDDAEDFPGDDSGALGFLFALGVLSFGDARPRGASEMHYQEPDEFGVGDFLDCLSHSVDGHLRFDADYVRGRRMKTRIVVPPDGPLVIETQGRGKSAEHWLARLRGDNRLRLISE